MTGPETYSVETVAADEERRLVDTLVLAFGADPLMRWLFQTPHEYCEWFPQFVRCYGDGAIAQGTAYHVRNFSGAALWLPPGTRPDEEGLAELLATALPEDKQADAWSLLEAVQRHYPDEPHWHLPLVGVEPTQQRKGYGSALVAHALEQCDRTGEVAYLESTNPANLSLYLRCGFELREPVQVGSMPPVFPMIREPQS